MSEWAVPGYTELKQLGAGGFGSVVLARHDATGTPVAIKYLLPQAQQDPDSSAMFRAEAESLSTLDDPHVVRLYEYVESAAGAAIVMELVDGVTLGNILAQYGSTSPEAALVVLHGSLLGLAAAHARGVIHRDYKPANVLVNAHGASKLTDFGIAARAGTPTIPAGSVAYAPPEQFDGGLASAASDVYAATATFYECLAGQPPFTGPTIASVIEQHQTAEVPMGPVPEPLRPIVARGLAKDPRYRPSDAAALAQGLRTAAVSGYGPEWEQRGRSQLGEAALLLALLWPSAGLPALQGSAVEQVHLSHGAQHAHNVQAAHHTQATQAQLHRWHLRHILHRRHLTQLRASKARTATRTATRLRNVTAAVTTAAVVAAVATVAYTSRTPGSPGSSPAHPAVAAYQAPLTPPATISATLDGGYPDPAGDTYVLYAPKLGVTASVILEGEIAGVATGEVARLYAQQFPYTSAPAPVQVATLNAIGGKTLYQFLVPAPALATRYQVRLLRNASATTPLAASAIKTIYVVDYSQIDYNPTSDTVNSGNCPSIELTCTATYAITIYVPPSALQTEMSRQKYLYRDVTPAGSFVTTSLWLQADGTLSVPQRVGNDAYEIIASFSNSKINLGSIPGICVKETEAQDGVGLPGPSACGSESIPASAGYAWGGPA